MSVEARKALLLTLAAVLLFGTPGMGAEYRCAEDKHVIAVCFDVHGRIAIPANSRTELWEIGTKRVIGLQYPGDLPSVGGELIPLPEKVATVLAADPSAEIFGDFTLCPFSAAKPGRKQYACIEQVKNIVTRPTQHRD